MLESIDPKRGIGVAGTMTDHVMQLQRVQKEVVAIVAELKNGKWAGDDARNFYQRLDAFLPVLTAATDAVQVQATVLAERSRRQIKASDGLA